MISFYYLWALKKKKKKFLSLGFSIKKKNSSLLEDIAYITKYFVEWE